LEKDAHEMEQRLKSLQERLKQQQLEDMSTPKPGGSRWTGARADEEAYTDLKREKTLFPSFLMYSITSRISLELNKSLLKYVISRMMSCVVSV
jgi:hypothetical protein